jgi:hypothetical protein
VITFDVKSGGSDELPLIPCRYSRAAVADHEPYTAHARGGCPGRLVLEPADQGNKHTSNSEIPVASQLFGGGARRMARLLITIFAKDAPAQQAPFCASGTSASFAFNAQQATKIICKGRAQRIHFKKSRRRGKGSFDSFDGWCINETSERCNTGYE